MTRLPIFRNSKVVELQNQLEKLASLAFYRDNGALTINAVTDLVETEFEVEDVSPQLDGGRADLARSELANAKAIFQYLGRIDHVAARDERLWSYLTHVVFPDYCRSRWRVTGEEKDVRRVVLERWFMPGSGLRALRHNAIARLWWAAELTHDPWSDPEFECLQADRNDPWAYTRVLLGLQDTITATLERDFGSDRKILLAFLETIRENEQDRQNGRFVKRLAVEVNLRGYYRDLGVLDLPRVVVEMRSMAEVAAGG